MSHTKPTYFPNQDLTVFTFTIKDAVLIETGDSGNCCNTNKKRKKKREVLVINYPLIDINYSVSTD